MDTLQHHVWMKIMDVIDCIWHYFLCHSRLIWFSLSAFVCPQSTLFWCIALLYGIGDILSHACIVRAFKRHVHRLHNVPELVISMYECVHHTTYIHASHIGCGFDMRVVISNNDEFLITALKVYNFELF